MKASDFTDLNLPERILLGPGPSMMPARVSQALAMPIVGHLDPSFLAVMDDVKELLRYAFQTKNEFTIPVSGTGSAAMEAALSNFIEPGDHVLIGVIGYFGERMVEMAERYGAKVDRLDVAWGEVLETEVVAEALKKERYKLLALVHGETSSGALQPNIKAIAEATHANGALLLLDTIASLGGVPVEVDAWDVDVAFTAAQKALSASPGVSPITLNQRALDVLAKRKTPVGNWYMDLTAIQKYWGGARNYHHTAPVNLNYALREALRMVAEEGLEARFARHQSNVEMLWEGLEDLDLEMLVRRENRMTTLTTVKTPPSADANVVKQRLLDEYNIEIAGGFGPLAGQIWRVGLMGGSSRREYVSLFLAALREILSSS
jgi:alanine-glyoxylate transaminase/serine-glyoxylate transaminase/serine-pyruvate transaminase